MTAAGRAAYEAYARELANHPLFRWENRPEGTRRLWDAIAQAAVDAAESSGEQAAHDDSRTG